jgi:FdhD protein
MTARAHSPAVAALRRPLAEEVPVALVFNGGTQAVMMATPADLADLMTGFAISEGIAPPDEVMEVEVIEQPPGYEARLWLPAARAAALAARRRALVGAVGCGLCGVDSIAAAMRTLPPLPPSDFAMTAAEARAALKALSLHQPLHDATRAVHAAAFWTRDGGILLAREDVGRHNALDKLIGALARAGIAPSGGAVLMTSRLSVELVQKAVTAGVPALLSVSAPTAQAVRLAEASGLTLATLSGSAVLPHSHPCRIGNLPHVA